jgi:hypothetical protein
MSVIYDHADETVHEMAREILERHHPELRLPDKSFVRLCILIAADPDKPDESAVKCHGYPAQAVVSVIPYKQRVDKRADAEIIIDQRNWENLTEPQQRAVLDHEITHLEFVIEDNIVKTDDQGRPKLRLRLHDYTVEGFRTIARRYGDDAPEVIAARAFEKDYGQDVLGRPGEPALPFHLNKETLEGPAKRFFGKKLVSVEDGPHGPTITVDAGEVIP